ncbi:hypothetical protein PYCCODRAFT_1441195 [Trametes coccinea BRFM310]|uniref:Uncharacterized protein n=1 Tax=Trametes coccinea (strain BRFM310) TaxID=1353009 RepID=A0A1Y2I6F3_TRAC3|nr:hypothetical protein PYCCODRAFT_1441195 [Trametes coccinea BRFM310]
MTRRSRSAACATSDGVDSNLNIVSAQMQSSACGSTLTLCEWTRGMPARRSETPSTAAHKRDAVARQSNPLASVGGHPPDTTQVEPLETCALRGTAFDFFPGARLPVQRCAEQWSNQY